MKKSIYRRATSSTEAFYRAHHEHQTLEFVLSKKKHYAKLNHCKASVIDMVRKLDDIVDESDPDLSLPQSHHALQTAEGLRKSGAPEWLTVVGFIHDLGKVLTLWGEPQWAVVGDTFPVGCAFEQDAIVHGEYLAYNSDKFDKCGIYAEGCGWDGVHFSWGHDEYLYMVLSAATHHLPPEALYIVRYHSFYPGHSHGAYRHLMSRRDEELLPLLKQFQQSDLYTKEEVEYDEVTKASLMAYYERLVNKYLPGEIWW